MKTFKTITLSLGILLGIVAGQGFAQNTLYFPQVATGALGDGSIYRTTVLIFNLNDQPAAATLELFDDTGRRLNTILVDSDGNRVGPAGTFNLTIAPQGIRRYFTDNSGSLVAGWARLNSAQELKASLIIQNLDSRSNVITEAGVPSSTPLRSFTIYNDNLRSDTATGLAVANLSASDPANLTLRLFTLSGTPVGAPKTITLPPLNHLGRFITDPLFFPEAARTEGFLTVSSSTDVIALSLRYDGPQLTTVPVVSGGRDIPVIGTVTPTQGPVGATITIDGQNFAPTPGGNTVRFGGRAAVVATASPTRLVTSVPTGAATGPLTVTVGGQQSNAVTFTVTSGTPNPAINTIAPNTVRAGSDDFDLTVNGANFLSESRIRFGATYITTTVVSTVQLVGRVPRALITTVGQVPIVVVTATSVFGGPESNPATFNVTSDAPVGAPQIASLEPNSGPMGGRVLIRGTNFDPGVSNNVVKISGVQALVRSATATELDVMVPYGVSSGPITVAVNGRVSNRLPFTVLPTPALVRVPVGLNPGPVVYNPVNQTALVAAVRESTVYVIDLASNTVRAQPSTAGGSPTGIAIEPNLNVALAANRSTALGTLGLIDLNTNTTLPFLTLSRLIDQPFDVAINPNTGIAVVSDRTSSVAYVDLNTRAEVGTGTRVPNANHIAINPNTNQAYITNFVDNVVVIVDMGTQAVVGTIPVGTRPFGVAINPASNVAVVANYGGNTVSVIDTLGGRVRATIPVGGQPFRVAINPSTNIAVATNSFEGTISIIDLNIDRVIETRATGGVAPQGVAINPINNTAIVSNNDSNDLSIMRLP